MSVSIKVAVRVRPFTCDDDLGVLMYQHGEDDGEVQLIKSKYSTSRFAFSYSWWTGLNYKRHIAEDSADRELCAGMVPATQEYCNTACGQRIRDDLMGGNAIVLFAYGLSGSGKTFTVFGPDAADSPDAWFKFDEPTGMWGILPRLAHSLFKERDSDPDKQQTWKIKMKYFQVSASIFCGVGEESRRGEGGRGTRGEGGL